MAASLRRRGALSIQLTQSLIEHVKSFDCLWNPEHIAYTHRTTVARAWAYIANEVKLPEDLIRAKWKNLRDLFMKEIKRTKVMSVEDYHGKWRYFKKLSFLYRVVTSEQAISESEDSETTNVSDPIQYSHEVKKEPTEGDFNEFVFLDADREADAILPEKRTPAEKNSRIERDDVSDIIPEAPKRRRGNQLYADGDCDMMFLMSLNPFFKLLKPVRKLILRSKIQDLILKEIEPNTANGQL